MISDFIFGREEEKKGRWLMAVCSTVWRKERRNVCMYVVNGMDKEDGWRLLVVCVCIKERRYKYR